MQDLALESYSCATYRCITVGLEAWTGTEHTSTYGW